jgi:hypothetical protein
VKKATMKRDTDEKELFESVQRGEWKSAGGGKRERARYSRYAEATFRKHRRLNIRLSRSKTSNETLGVSPRDPRAKAAPTRSRTPSRGSLSSCRQGAS